MRMAADFTDETFHFACCVVRSWWMRGCFHDDDVNVDDMKQQIIEERDNRKQNGWIGCLLQVDDNHDVKNWIQFTNSSFSSVPLFS